MNMTACAVQYARRRVEEVRRDRPSSMPDWLKTERNRYRDTLLSEAKKSYEDTGIWFLARGNARETDEMETKAIWVDLLSFVQLKDLPGYSDENHSKAIAFWQSWQNLETGQLYNPLYQDPQKPHIKRHTPGNKADYTPQSINAKYIPNILAALGAELPLPIMGIATQVRDIPEDDIFDELWEAIAARNPSPAGAFPFNAALALEAGNLHTIPQIEAGMGALLRAYNPDTGMWRPDPMRGFPWPDYRPSAGFKIISRICGYMGMEN